MATFTRADKEIEELVNKVISEHYPELDSLLKHDRFPLTFDLLMVWADEDANGEPKGPALKHHGWPADAVIKAVDKASRALGRADVEIRFDANRWEEMNEEQREALVDHELYHLSVRQEDGIPKRDDMGRVLFKMRQHDYEFGWFVEIAKRRGLASAEVYQAKRIMAENGQWLFSFAEQPGLGLRVVPPPTAMTRAETVQEREEREERELAAGGGAGRPPEARAAAQEQVSEELGAEPGQRPANEQPAKAAKAPRGSRSKAASKK